MPNTIGEKAAKAFDLSPIVLGIGEVYTSLQTGAIDAIAAPPSAAFILQWYSKVKYMTDVPLLYTYAIMTIDKKHFTKIDAADQALVTEIFTATFVELDKNNRESNRQALAKMSEQGIEMVKPSAQDVNEWNDYAKKATVSLVEEAEFSQAILSEMEGHLAEYRASH